QLSDAVRAPENLYWTFSIQRQLSSSTVLELGYNATTGSHLQTGLVNLNQVPTATLDRLVSQFGAQQAANILNSAAGGALAQQAGIGLPYANFTNPNIQRTTRNVAQSLRPYPNTGHLTTFL
ncbi:MAG: hypothetical protein ABIZ80_22110, partial [Bryobacteraceae bacterium]